MSINHFSTDLPETPWWPQQHQQQPIMEPNPNSASSTSERNKPNSSYPSHLFHHYQQYHQSWLNPYTNNTPQESPSSMFPTHNPAFNFNLNQEDDEDQDQEHQQKVQQEQEVVQQRGQEVEDQKEHMFEKPLTPSDVGKLNRLVIPKQHAEKYFPLGGGDSGDKGLLLSFEDETGKCWRFRYSYWTSSQSYVLTKGWSRYVKEKQLDAGDVVLFERHRTDSDRLFIGWRRRGESSSSGSGGGAMVQSNSGGVWSRGLYSPPPGLQPYLANVGTTSVPYQPDCLHAGIV